MNQYIESADPIIMEDFQSCPDKPLFPRTSKPNTLSSYLSQFLMDHNLTPIDIALGDGPNYTYQHLSLPNSSYIDHILIPDATTHLVSNVHVLQPDALNTSDHIPVKATLNIPKGHLTPTSNHQTDLDFIPNYMWKNSQFVRLYSHKISLAIETTSARDLESMIHNLHTSLRSCASECFDHFKKKHYNFPSKPWRNDELRRSRNILQQMFSIWQGNNFPRLESDTSYNRYRYARKTFRSLVKHAKNQATVDHYINIEKLKKIKPKTYWKEMKILNNKPKRWKDNTF